MMILKKTAYVCKCDNCGNHWIDEYAGNIGFSDELGIHHIVARDSSWLVKGSEHYCPDCWQIDAAGNAVPKKSSHKIS